MFFINSLQKMKVITIGRYPDNNVVINEPIVGRHHAKIIQHSDGHYTILDLNSKNGTFVNGKRIFEETRLNLNDVVKIGHTTLDWSDYFKSSSKSPSQTSSSSAHKKKSNVLKAFPVMLVLIGGIILAVVLFSDGQSNGNITYEQPQQETNTIIPRTSDRSNIRQKISVGDIADDLVGQVITAPSDDGYFPKEWRWEIENGEVLEVKELNREKDQSGYEVITIFAHLHKGSVKIDVEMILKYSQNGGRRVLTHSRTTKLIIPRQTDYSQCVELKMDYDFLPSLMLHNHSNMTLFVGGDYSSGEQRVLFSTIVKPLSSEMVAVGSIQNYHVHFAYEK